MLVSTRAEHLELNRVYESTFLPDAHQGKTKTSDAL